MRSEPKNGRGPIWGSPLSICEVNFFLVFLDPLSVTVVKKLNCHLGVLGPDNISLDYQVNTLQPWKINIKPVIRYNVYNTQYTALVSLLPAYT